ncbi:MAG: primosomal protein N', partial [Ghiorsea sp.]|nr:primosomal protein N' [Ghiorsea sp.]
MAAKPKQPNIYIQATVFAPLWQKFDYAWPNDLGDPQIGVRIIVPLGHSKRVAVIEDIIEQAATDDMKQVIDRLDEHSLYSHTYWGWLQRASAYYLRTIGEMYALALAWAALDKQRRFKCLDRDELMRFDDDLAHAFTSKRTVSLSTIAKHCETHGLQWRVFQAVKLGVLEEVWQKPSVDSEHKEKRLQLREAQQQAVTALCE